MTIKIRMLAHRYYVLAKPGIVYGNAIAVIAGFCLASATYGFDVIVGLVTVVCISLIMAGACVYNNIIDRRIDGRMERTKKRALVTGLISVRSAAIFATILMGVGFMGLWYFTNAITVLIGLVGILDYVVLYAIAKRRSVFGTVVGTVSGAAPPVAGYTALSGRIDTAAVLIFVIMFFWQMAHFYAIALMRTKDYKAAGIPVHSVLLGADSTKFWTTLFIIGFAVTAPLLTVYGYTGVVYALTMVGVALYWLYAALHHYKLQNSDVWARIVFKKSLLSLLVFCAALSIGAYIV